MLGVKICRTFRKVEAEACMFEGFLLPFFARLAGAGQHAKARFLILKKQRLSS